MAHQTLQRRARGFWRLAQRQYGVVTRGQLLALGFSPEAIKHRVAKGKLHPVWRGVYAVGRPELSQHGQWMAAVLGCGPRAVLSHESAAVLWGIRPANAARRIEISVPPDVSRKRPGIVVHRRHLAASEVTRRDRIPVTTPVCTLVDLAARLPRDALEAAINEADIRDLIDLERVRAVLDEMSPRPGRGALRRTLDRRTFRLTRSQLERWLLPIAKRAGLPRPQTRAVVNGFEVDFHWPELGLVVESDGLRYHRTPAEQARDRLRDQTHTRAGLTVLRFTHAQIRYEPRYVEETLAAVARRLRARAA